MTRDPLKINDAFVKKMEKAAHNSLIAQAAGSYVHAKMAQPSFARTLFGDKAERMAHGYLLHVLGRNGKTACGQHPPFENDRYEKTFVNGAGPFCDMCEACWLTRDKHFIPGAAFTLVAMDDDNAGQYMFTIPQRPFIVGVETDASGKIPYIGPTELKHKASRRPEPGEPSD